MAKTKAEVTLGGERYPIEVPTLDQLQQIIEHQAVLVAAKTQGEQLAAGFEIMAIMVNKPKSEIRATLVELVDALPVVMRVSGLEELMKRGADAAKKAKAAAKS